MKLNETQEILAAIKLNSILLSKVSAKFNINISDYITKLSINLLIIVIITSVKGLSKN